MFGQIIPIQLRYSIYEQAEDGSLTLTVQGEFTPEAEQA